MKDSLRSLSPHSHTMHEQQTAATVGHSSKSIAIMIGVGLSLYLVCIYSVYESTSVTIRVSSYQIDELFDQQQLRFERKSSKDFLKVVSKPSCGRFPALVDLNVSDTYWQLLTTSNGTFYLYNAYYDDREAVTANGSSSVVRILALIDRIDPTVNVSCQLWFEGVREALVSDVSEYRLLWNRLWGANTKGASPYLLSCKNPLSERGIAPTHVSLTEGGCEKRANNVLEVRNKRPAEGVRKRRFLVSVKGVDFADDVSLLLIEWCEILRLLGVDRVEVFVVSAHANVKRVLQFYEQRERFVALKYLRYPHQLPNKISESWIQWSQNDLVPFHDSFYENLRLFEYMVPMDIDEFIVPVRAEDRTWTAIIERTVERLKHEELDCFPVVNRYFLLKSAKANETVAGIPKSLRFLPNIYRAANFTPHGGNVKSFLRMDRIVAVHNHFPFSCVGPETCRCHDVSLEDGQLSHYRSDCDNPECKESKPNPTRDVTLWKFREEILRNVNRTIEELRSFQSDIEGSEIKLGN